MKSPATPPDFQSWPAPRRQGWLDYFDKSARRDRDGMPAWNPYIDRNERTEWRIGVEEAHSSTKVRS